MYEENFQVARVLKKNLIVGIISDQCAESAEILRNHEGLNGLFYPILFSPEVGLTKKKRDIFDRARQIIGAAPDHAHRLLMIDDHASVLAIAAEAGWKCLLCKDYKLLRTNLQLQYGLL